MQLAGATRRGGIRAVSLVGWLAAGGLLGQLLSGRVDNSSSSNALCGRYQDRTTRHVALACVCACSLGARGGGAVLLLTCVHSKKTGRQWRDCAVDASTCVPHTTPFDGMHQRRPFLSPHFLCVRGATPLSRDTMTARAPAFSTQSLYSPSLCQCCCAGQLLVCSRAPSRAPTTCTGRQLIELHSVACQGRKHFFPTPVLPIHRLCQPRSHIILVEKG